MKRVLAQDEVAAASVEFKLVDSSGSASGELLEYYDPSFLSKYYSKKPLTVVKRLSQIAFTFGEFLACTAGDLLAALGLARADAATWLGVVV